MNHLPPYEVENLSRALNGTPKFAILVDMGRAPVQVRRSGFVVSFGRREVVLPHRAERILTSGSSLELLSGLFMPDLHPLLPPPGNWHPEGRPMSDGDAQEAVWAFWDAVRERGIFKEEAFRDLFSDMDALAVKANIQPNGPMTELERAISRAMEIPGFSKETLMRVFDAQVVKKVMDR